VNAPPPPVDEPSFAAQVRAWWKRRSRKSKAGIIVGLVIALIIIIPAPAEEEGDERDTAATETAASEAEDTRDASPTTEAATTTESAPPPPPPPIVAQVVDGDTIRLEGGTRVRLVQVDAPEIGQGECYARNSRRALATLIPPGTEVRLAADPRLDKRDRFGRALRYVFVGRQNINVVLVRQGAAAPYFFNDELGRFAARLLRAAQQARAAHRGLWRACGATELDPFGALTTRRPPPPPPGAGKCEDVTSYDYNWDNDMKCTRSDGSIFYTDYAGAERFESTGAE
jgi:micrococcal nuclease